MHTPLPTTYSGSETRTNEPALLGAGLFAAVLFSPSLLDVVLVVNLALLGVVGLLHLAAASLARARADAGGTRPARRWAREPFVSVHVPLSRETPDVVARTLDALRRLEWTAYEVVVVDAAREPSLWRPVERRCARLGPRFRFVHAPGLRGDRAAALNLCLEESDPRAELVLVLDPGVRVHPKLLVRAARYFDAPGVSHVQFVTAFAGPSAAAGVRGDRASYSNVFSPFGEVAEASLPSGTPCLVQRRALALVGGWRPSRVGEEAELGVRFLEAGLKGRFAAEVSARGTLPTSLRALRVERRRRVFTSASALFHLDAGALRALGWKRSLGVVAQLTAWFDFLLLPALALPLLAFVPGAGEAHQGALFAATAAFPLHLALRGGVYLIAPRSPDEGAGPVRSLLARLGFLWEGSTAWIEALFGVRLAPQPEDDASRTTSARHAAVPLLVAAALAVSSGGFLYGGRVGAALACVLAAWMFGAVLYVQWELLETARLRRPARAADATARVVVGEALSRAVAPTRRPLGAPALEVRPELEQRPRWHLRAAGDRHRPLGRAIDLRSPRGG